MRLLRKPTAVTVHPMPTPHPPQRAFGPRTPATARTRPGRLAIALAACWALAACTTTPYERQHDLVQLSTSHEAWVKRQALAAAAAPPIYRIQIGDVMDLRFRRGGSELNESLTVRPDGRVTLPSVGEQHAAGLTPAELTREIEARYAGLLRDPRLDLMMRQMQPQRVFVGGEVTRPGELRLSGPTSLLQAIVQAGDFTPDAERASVIVVRQRGTAEPEYIRVDFGSAIVRRLAQARESPCADTNPLACPGAEPLRPEAFMLDPMDLVIVPKGSVAGVAQFFDRYVGQILPLWRNFGINASYILNRDTVVVPDTR